MSKKAPVAAAAVPVPVAAEETHPKEENENAEPSGPMAHFIIRVGEGKKLTTADRPTPTLTLSYSFGGSDHESETITGNADPNFGFEKQFDLPATEALVKELMAKPIEFKIFDTKPVGKTQEKVVIGKAQLSLLDLVFWKEQSEEEEMASIVTMTKTVNFVELGAESALNVFVQAPEYIIPKKELDSINIMTLRILSVHGLPPTWLPKEGEDPAAIPFNYNATCLLPFGEDGHAKAEAAAGTLVLGGPKPSDEGADGGAENNEPQIEAPKTEEDRRKELHEKEPYLPKINWDYTTTFILGAADTVKLKTALAKQSLDISIQKVLKSGNPYPYTRRYQGIAHVDGNPLLTPGNAAFEGRFDIQPTQEALLPLTDEEKALLPEPVDPKAPPAKGAKAPAKGAKPTGPEFEIEPEQDPDRPHPFLDQLTYLRVQISMFRPIVPAPPPPRPPLPKVADLIPHRPYMPPFKPPMDASEEFTRQLTTVVDEIADEYIRMFAAAAAGGGGGGGANNAPAHAVNPIIKQLATSGDVLSSTGGGSNNSGNDGPDERRQKLGLHLTKTGAYFTFKERLKAPVQKIVREKFHKANGDMSEEELKVLCNDLYVYLNTLLNRALNKKFKTEPPPETNETEILERIEQHRKLAEEAEMMLNLEAASRHYNQRVVLYKHREDLWFDFGAYNMRVHDIQKAEECFREAIALNPQHLQSLLSYGSLICLRDKITTAETFFTAATSAHSKDLLAWALLGLFYDLENKHAERRKIFKLLMNLEDELGEPRKSPYIRAAHFLNSIHCTQLVERALSQELLRSGPTVEIGILLGTAYFNHKDHDNARKHLLDVLRNLDKRSGLAMCLMGHSHFMEKQTKEAISYYEQALQLRNPYIDVTLYMRVAALCASINKQFEAKDYYLKACKLHPTSSSWLGLGMACFNMAQLSEAEEALAEANILDPHNAEVWGWLTILSLKTGKMAEAESSFKEALKNNLVSVSVLREIGRGYYKHGKVSTAEGAVRRALAQAEDAGSYRILGDVLNEYKELENSLECYKKVVALARAGDDRRHSLRQLVSICKTLNRLDDAATYAQLPDIVSG